MILLRHGQSEFNVHMAACRRDPGLPDPGLTEFGHAQAAAAGPAMAALGIRRILCSPYRRALQTAAPIAAAIGVPVSVQPVVRERYAFACDIGSPRDELARCWPDIDFSHLDEVWWPAIEEPAAAVEARALLFRSELAALPDWRQTLVVSHWGFIVSLSGQSIGNCEWLRCEPAPPADPAIP
jgi:broad specificity phosphatase PhoE